MTWVKQGLIYVPDGSRPWSRTHAQVPTAMRLDDRIRIYYATRDDRGRSLTSFIDVDPDDPSRLVYVHDAPVLDLGAPGTHDEDGVMTGCVVREGQRVWLYYTGWSRGATVPYRVSVGLAISDDGGVSFTRHRLGPVVDRTPDEPFMTMSPYIVREGALWRMWYGSGLGWVDIDGHMEPRYAIKYAESSDGCTWRQPNRLCIAPLDELEANTRPSVMKRGDAYEMWFSYRSSRDFRDGAGAYRIGRAISDDGLTWRRTADAAGLEPSRDEAWDDRMVAYPNVIEIDGRRVMFYNGNGFGRAGMGWAIWEEG